MSPTPPVLVSLTPPQSPENQFAAAVQALATAATALVQVAALLAGSRPAAGPVVLPDPPGEAPFLLPDLINEFLISRARAGRSNRYINHLHQSCKNFVRGRQGLPAATITAREVEAWLAGLKLAARTKKGLLLDLRTLFQFGVKRGYFGHNPAAAVEVPQSKTELVIGIHTPAQVAAVLAAARAFDLNICRCLAIRYFTGLRSSEANRLEESEIFLDRGFIEVKTHKSKTRNRRLVTIPDNLKAWLALGGQLPLRDVNIRLARFVKACGVPWPHNVTRHSFVSYHLAKSKNAAASALEAGHSEAMLFGVYRELVSPEAAALYWSIVPEGLRVAVLDRGGQNNA